jgi:hypothetical protein
MKRTTPITAFWFICENSKLIQCKKNEFDRAIKQGKSVKYKGYPNKKTERIAEQLEASRMAFLTQPNLSANFRSALTNPRLVIAVQVIAADDPLFWEQESKHPKNN